MAAAKEARKRHPAVAKADEATTRRRREEAGPQAQVGLSAGHCREPPTVVEIDGRQLKLSNLDKVLYPETGFTKGEVIDYYAAHRPGDARARRRPGRHPAPLPRRRRRRQSFFEKRCPSHRPDWVPVRPRAGRPRRARSSTAGSTPGRAGVGRQHGRARGPRADGPLRRHRDADDGRVRPRPRARRPTSTTAARWRAAIRDVARRLRAEVWPKTSGSKGLQLYLPVNRPGSPTSRRRPSPRRSPRPWRSHHADRVTVDHGQGPAARQGVHRLEPEQPAQDHRRARTRCGPGPARRCRRRSPGTRSRPAPTGDADLVFEAADVLDAGRRARRPLRRRPDPGQDLPAARA